MPITEYIQCYHTCCEKFAKRLHCYDSVAYDYCKFNPFRKVHETCTIGIFERIKKQAQLELELMDREEENKA